ncbi:IS1 family transposase [Chryseobacterium aquaticum]|uniref:IS1 family transposase n=1 Tax=Chryseobacterium aquaticum TaxID=452084 RepID=A0A848NB68_9FLAO|nr:MULTISPECIES: IS1 family transposase [Chryseobacterium]NMR34683.1 IS1 family transposase [Chryseobacterium aquaticum]NRQ46931.1 IS1 family transposase [Chryseobacterium sp. C-204]
MQSTFYTCSRCVGENSKFIKFGKTKNGKQRFQCTSCRKTSVLNYSYQAYRKNTNTKIIRLTKEGMGIRSISRFLRISATTLLKRIINISKCIHPPLIDHHKTYEVDELRTYVRYKKQIIWLVYALERDSKNILCFNLGKRSNDTLNVVIKSLLHSNPEKIYTDKLRNYQYLIPKGIHHTKRFGTNSIERKNLSIRTHLKRFNRKTICFSKNVFILNAILKIYFWL